MGTPHAHGAQSDIALPKGGSLRKVSGAAKDVSILLEMLAWSVPASGEVGTLWSHTASQPPCMGSQKGEKDSRSISLRQVGPISRKSCMSPLSTQGPHVGDHIKMGGTDGKLSITESNNSFIAISGREQGRYAD